MPVFVKDNGVWYLSSNDSDRFRLSFDASTFSTGANLTYSDGAVGLEPLNNSTGTMSGGSWMDIFTNPMLNDCFYATISGNGEILHKLNPNNLATALDGTDVSTEITQENVMFVIPTRYITRNAYGITHSRNPSDGEAYAHTVGGHTYKYLGIGVYPAVNVNGVLKSISGSILTGSLRRDVFRSYVKANGTPSNGNWMLWNWHQYALYRDMVLFATCDWDSQGIIGKGNLSGNSNTNWVNNGLYNASGVFAGSQTTGAGYGVKAFIEDMWGELWQFVDDVVTGDEYSDGTTIWKDLYAGQNATPVISDNEASSSGTINYSDKEIIARIKVATASATQSAGWKYGVSINTGSKGWGVPDSWGGSTSTYSHDGCYTAGVTVTDGVPTVTTARNVLVGGCSHDGLHAGFSSLSVANTVSHSAWGIGARVCLAFDEP